MLENTNTKQTYPGPILNTTLQISTFLFKDPEQVKLTKTYTNDEGIQVEENLTYGTDYEVTKTLADDISAADASLTASVGEILLKPTVSVLAGQKLTAYRESELTQEVSYPRTGPFPAKTHEGALDYLTMQNQEQQEQIDRSLKVPVSTGQFNASMPIPIAARALKINSEGTGFEMSEYDPDTALVMTEEFKKAAQEAAASALVSKNTAESMAESASTSALAAQNAADAALASQSAAASSSQSAIEQATIATAKTSEVVESGNNAITAITEQETTSKNNIETKGAEQVTLIQNEGAIQIANVQSTGFYMRDDKLYFINSQGEETEFKSGGSGLEVCDIGMALYVDETKGLRRYLNGQIVDINTNTQAFLNRLKEITTLHPSLLCTEDEWQTAKTMSAFGQVGKFVFNYSGDEVVSVRIPRVVNVQGLFDLQILGMTIEAGLPNITGNIQAPGIYANSYPTCIVGSGAFVNSKSDNTFYGTTAGTTGNVGCNFDASRSNPIYGNSNTVQPEAIQYPYFIQIATGAETENNIINDIELNNPFSLFDSKYSDHELNNLSWLKSEGQWNAKSVYPTAYDELLKEYNNPDRLKSTINANLVGTPTIKDCVISRFSDVNYAKTPSAPSNITSYEWHCKFTTGASTVKHKGILANLSINRDTPQIVVDDTGTDISFLHPLNASTWTNDIKFTANPNTTYWTKAIWDGVTVSLYYKTNASDDWILSGSAEATTISWTSAVGIGIDMPKYPFNGSIDLNETYININGERWWTGASAVKKENTTDIITDYDFRINTADETFRLPLKTIHTDDNIDSLYLYYYVGETVQNANLIDAGRIEEQVATQLANKQDKCIHLIDTYKNGASWYRVYSDGWIEQGGAYPAAGAVTVSFIKPFTSTNYNFIISGTFNLLNNEKTTTHIRFDPCHGYEIKPAGYWVASGY